jgi:DNA-binding transcriptional LysR family regulator
VIELRLIQHALALARFGNFGHAAESLGISQPSMTRSIATLEETLGVKLFDRNRRGIEPTAFGAVFLAQGQVLLDGEAALHAKIESLAGLQEGTLVIGAGPYASEISVGRTVARVSMAHPQVRLEITSADPEEIIRLVKDGRCEVGVVDVAGLEHEPELNVETLPAHEVHLACRPEHPLAQRPDFQLEEALKFPLVSTTLRGTVAAIVGNGSAVGRLDPYKGNFAPAILVNSLSLARQIACESDALFPGTAAMLAADQAAGRLVRLNFRIPIMRTNYGIVRRRDRTPSPALELFVRVLREVETELARA